MSQCLLCGVDIGDLEATSLASPREVCFGCTTRRDLQRETDEVAQDLERLSAELERVSKEIHTKKRLHRILRRHLYKQ